jgi:SulP family sulfate permease
MLDFQRVIGIDASATLSFLRLKRLLRQHQVLLTFTHLRPEFERQLQKDVLTSSDQQTWRLFPDLDHGVEWFEELILQGEIGKEAQVQAHPGAVQAGQEQGGLALLFAAMGMEAEEMGDSADQALLHLMGYLERVNLFAGQSLIRQGEPHQYLYFLDSGELTIDYRTEEGQRVRLETSGPGAIVGELGLYLGTPASATVTAAQPGTAYSLSSESIHRLEQEDPRAAALLHRFLLKRVGQRLRSSLGTVEAMLD